MFFTHYQRPGHLRVGRRSYHPHRVLWSTLRVPNGLSERRRLTVVGRGHAVAPVIRSIPGSDLQAPFEFYSLLFDVSYGGRI